MWIRCDASSKLVVEIPSWNVEVGRVREDMAPTPVNSNITCEHNLNNNYNM